MARRSRTRKNFYAISRGDCAPSVVSSWQDAAKMVNGVPGNEHKAFDNFKDAVAWLSSAGHDTFHFCEGPVDGPEPESPGHGGESKCYVATGGRGAAIFTRYSDVEAHVYGVRNATQKSYADRKTAEAVLYGFGHLARNRNLVNPSDSNGTDEDELDLSLVAGMASVSLQRR